jgi:transglutaminase-like putative cysteine protease
MKKLSLLLLAFLLCFCSCNRNDHFISDPEYRAKVEKQFEIQKLLAHNRDSALFSVFKLPLSLREEEALKFLYAYMPLSDLADYDGQFFLNNVRTSFAARDSFSWGKTIPDDIFRHFVLPVRINNENLDSARMVFFRELKNRVKNLAMKEAVLEVNHWCHEKVTYKSTDSRTSSPLNTVLTSYGRCGEESTLTVAALRSVGIPARQCYTPRWAHCDDNHAWVEVWVDGKWHFLGACEPEFDLDLAWFTAPAKRAMIVSTNVFGNYEGPEEVLLKTDFYTRINLISNYAPVKTFWVKVLQKDGKPADSAEVEFCLYNYAEFFPVARKYADKNGIASLNTGLGDMLVWANNGSDFGFSKVTVEKADTVVIKLDEDANKEYSLELDLVPPVERSTDIKTDEKMKERNSHLLQIEDSCRNAYMITFADSLASVEMAVKLKLSPDSVWKILDKSEGNWHEIKTFIETAPAENRKWVLSLLFSLAEKDLHDTPAKILLSHLNQSCPFFNLMKYDEPVLFVNYILCPRIGNENLSDYKTLISTYKNDILGQAKDPEKCIAKIREWIDSNITINTTANYYNVSVSPKGTFELRVSDKNSRDILFVAICRSFGIPARIETATRKPQYYYSGWEDVNFDKPKEVSAHNGILTLLNPSTVKGFIPAYCTHFTLAIFKDGKYKTLDYEESQELKKFPSTLKLETGNYMMVTGTRLANGSVLARLQFFKLPEGQDLKLPVVLREKPTVTEILGKINLDIDLPEIGKVESVRPTVMFSQKGGILIWMDPDKEPTKHVMAEISALKGSFEKWGGGMLFLVSEKSAATFNQSKYSDLPIQKVFAKDDNWNYLKSIEKALNKTMQNDLPVLVVTKPNGDLIYVSSGYKIGTGEQLLKTVNLIN